MKSLSIIIDVLVSTLIALFTFLSTIIVFLGLDGGIGSKDESLALFHFFSVTILTIGMYLYVRIGSYNKLYKFLLLLLILIIWLFAQFLWLKLNPISSYILLIGVFPILILRQLVDRFFLKATISN